MAGQAKYMDKFYNTSYLIETKTTILTNKKTLQITAKINRIQKLSDLVNTAPTEEQCIKTRKEDKKSRY